jgi:hypothetical protein
MLFKNMKEGCVYRGINNGNLFYKLYGNRVYTYMPIGHMPQAPIFVGPFDLDGARNMHECSELEALITLGYKPTYFNRRKK